MTNIEKRKKVGDSEIDMWMGNAAILLRMKRSG